MTEQKLATTEDFLEAARRISASTTNRVRADFLTDRIIQFAQQGSSQELLETVRELHQLTGTDEVYDHAKVITRHFEHKRKTKGEEA